LHNVRELVCKHAPALFRLSVVSRSEHDVVADGVRRCTDRAGRFRGTAAGMKPHFGEIQRNP
jgi:hypothetical protein